MATWPGGSAGAYNINNQEDRAMDEGMWGFAIGIALMVAIAPFALMRFHRVWRRLKDRADE